MVFIKKIMANSFMDSAIVLRPRTNHRLVFGMRSFNRAADSNTATSDTAGSSPRIGITTRNVNTSLNASGERIFEIIHIATRPTKTNRALDSRGLLKAQELVVTASFDSSSKSISPKSKRNGSHPPISNRFLCLTRECIKRIAGLFAIQLQLNTRGLSRIRHQSAC